MLIQNYLPSCIEASCATSFSSEITKQDSCNWVSGAESLKMSPEIDERPLDGCRKINSKDGDPCSLNSVDGLRPSTFSAMSGSSKPIVYRRKKFRRNPLTTFSIETSAEVRPSNGCPSELCSEVHLGTFKEDLVAGVAVEKVATAAPFLIPAECNRGNLLSKSNSCDGRPEVEEQCSEAASRSDIQRTSDFCVNDSHSSLDFDSSSLKTDVGDASECSSSGALVPEGLDDNMPEKDICITILRGYGLLEKVPFTELRMSAKASGTSTNNCSLISCKACDCSDTTLKMLICDNCADAYHLSCCNPRIRKIPRDEWFCKYCLIKKRKLLEKSTCKSLSGPVETESSSNLLSEGESGPISLMLKDTSIYRTCVRIGNNFQAEVPDWTGPVIDEVDRFEPLEIRPSKYLSFDEYSSNKPSRFSSIGNWLQCRQVIEGIGEYADGSICGKWRRAPLFEVQTDDWECFRTVLWDPPHADCAVPQELETEEVLKQLKYIETLKPRLAIKRRKLVQTSGASSRCFTEN
ncbi:PREDICTED: histone-lysine N-methyltransferase 2C isoform X1 [Nicotiana attenuata]|uniref:Uncharacterized protein n=1 Tax=Nicotiana attenuata TaxID=49451 RepID=A0A1J6JGM7_NICAT|nr:PREDICTED: histone-lysine N-methyltransferase 2C isoform X1 [Nicotiana attenuata]OIT06129.1 hypothetical protein A4A49_05570 [Nicotiana attenuata]